MKNIVLIIIVVGLVIFLIPEMGRGVNGLMEEYYSNKSIDLKKEDVQWLLNSECSPFHADRIFARNLPLIRFQFNGINLSFEPSWFSAYFGGQIMDYRSLQLDTILTSRDKELIKDVSRYMNRNRLFLIEKQENGSILFGLKRQKHKLLLLAPGDEGLKDLYILKDNN